MILRMLLILLAIFYGWLPGQLWRIGAALASRETEPTAAARGRPAQPKYTAYNDIPISTARAEPPHDPTSAISKNSCRLVANGLVLRPKRS